MAEGPTKPTKRKNADNARLDRFVAQKGDMIIVKPSPNLAALIKKKGK